MNKKDIRILVENGITNKELSERYNCSVSTIRRFLKSNDLQRKVSKANENLREYIFQKIDTKGKAYWLGFLYADGYIYKKSNKTNRVFYKIVLDLGEKDEERIHAFCDFIGADKKRIKTLKRKGKYISKSISIYSKKICNDLEKLGCVQNKSKTIRLPDFKDPKLNLAFLLGFYDGDGDEHSCYLTCGSYNFLKDIKLKYNLESEILKVHKKTYRFNLKCELVNKMLLNYKNSIKRKRKTYSYNPKPRKNRLKFNIDKNELRELLKNNSLEKIGRMFDVSGSAIWKRAKKFGLK